MDASINIEAPKTKSTSTRTVADGIVNILKAGAKSNADQETIREALKVFAQTARTGAGQTHISGSSFQGDYLDKRKKK